nr:MAG TPA: major capsid protein [Caudoviricetes sp.]
MGVFNSKFFNSEVFGKYMETVPRVKQNAFLKAGILRNRPDLKSMLTEQTGGNFISVPMAGLIGGDALNYDGSTDITATTLETYMQSMIVVGRAKAWEEKDFTRDITSHDFMEDIATQVVNYWDDVDQATILSILKGIFGVTADSFNTKHTLDITGAGDASKVGATTLNNAIQLAAGDNKNLFTMVIMHSAVATNLENLQVLEYFKQTDENGIQKSVGLATWNGRTVLIDDDTPTEAVAAVEANPSQNIEAADAYTKYTTYVLGQGAFSYCDCGAAVPNETWRDPKTAGGKEMLITRQRKIFAPQGFSFVQPSSAIVSPTDTQLETAARWTVVKDSAGTGYYNTKAIPFARIISRG